MADPLPHQAEKTSRPMYIFGAGAVGLTLAAYLQNAGRQVTAVRTSKNNLAASPISISIEHGREPEPVLTIDVPAVSLNQLQLSNRGDAMAVITCKSYANDNIAAELKNKGFKGCVVILQNGVNVETAFIEAGFAQVHRCVLYVTSQTLAENTVKFRPIASCGIGVIHGSEADCESCVAALNLPGFEFHLEHNIQRLIWKKAIINAVYNSICPLLEVDNGIFIRNAGATALAQEVVEECLVLAHRLGLPLDLTLHEIMQQIMKISHGGNGVLISTLQDINHARKTEIESLNIAMAKMAAELEPPVPMIKTELLGRMTLLKSLEKMAGKG